MPHGQIKCHLAFGSHARSPSLPPPLTSVQWLSSRQPDLLAAYHLVHPKDAPAASSVPAPGATSEGEPARQEARSAGPAHSRISVHKAPVGLDYEASILARMRAMK